MLQNHFSNGSNITERKKIEQENRFLQHHNAITKLYNSYFFKTLLDEHKSKVDDFGSDYSSLKYLQQLPIDKIKIDKSFIDGLVNNINQQKIVRAIIQLVQQLGLATLAEGVETTAQKNLLIEYGCDEIQGYIIGKPMTGNEFISFLLDRT